MQRSTWTTVMGALVGAAAGLVIGALLALMASAVLLFLSLGTSAPIGWTDRLIQPAAMWIAAGGLAGALIGRRIARRAAADTAEQPPRPV